MKTISLFLLFLILGLVGMAQNKTAYQISGKITDSLTKNPVHTATVFLKNSQKVLLKSAVSKQDGSFVFEGLTPGNYLINVVFIGHQTKIVPVILSNSSIVLPTITIMPSSTQLKGVTVTADRPLVRQEIDRIAYDVKADPESKVNNVLEMMRKVPLLSLDGDDNIQLQGNSNYKILINGKPSGMMERNPKDILKSMPASSIERIEVITTPPAKYDGDGLAGIINIVTFKKVDNGSNGSVNINERFPVGGPGVGGSFTVKTGKFGISTNAGGSLNESPLLANSNSRITQGAGATNLFQSGNKDFSGKTGYAGVELSFDIDSLNLISGQLNYNANANKSFTTQYSILNNASSILNSYELNNSLESSGNGIDAAINYQLGSKKDKNRLLTFSYRYYNFTNSQFNSVDLFNVKSNISNVNYNSPNYQQDNDGGSTEQTFQVDYVYPSKKITIEAGIKAIFRDNNSDFQFLSLNSAGIYQPDALKTNIFDNQQNVYGIYNTYQFTVKNWGVKAGIRVEQTSISANFYGAGSELSNNSLNFMPSISFNRKFKDMSSINFGFASRIQRPGINQLNPFVDRSNPNFESSGNPDLKPTAGQSVEVNYSRFKKLSLNVSFRGMFFDNLIMPRVVTDPITNITRSSYGNTGSGTLLGLGVNINYPFNSKLRGTLGLMANYGMVKGEINGVKIDNKGLMRRGFSSITYRPSKTWQGTASINYNGPNLSLQGSSNAYISSSFSLSKDLFDNKFSISLAANNAFSKYRNAINYTNGPNFTQESYNQNYQRNFTTSVNYRFGKLKEGIKKNKKGIDNNDVSGGSSL